MKKLYTLLLLSTFIGMLPGCEWCECIHTKKDHEKTSDHTSSKDKDSDQHKAKHHDDHTDKKPEHHEKKDHTPKPKEHLPKEHKAKEEHHTAKAKTPPKGKAGENPMAAAMEAAAKK